MIDIIINDFGGLTVVHDQKDLDGYTGVQVDLPDGAVSLTSAEGQRSLGKLKPAMLGMLAEGVEGRMIRMSGWSLAKICPLNVSIRH